MTFLSPEMLALSVPVFEKILRPVLVYAFLVICLRIFGKRELAQLNPFDLVVLLTLSNTVQNAIIGNDTSLLGGVIGATTLLLMNYIVVRFMFHHPKVERLVAGAPVVLVTHGKLHEKRLKRELISVAELRAAARRQGVESLHEVDEAILEPGGTISFLRREPTPESARYEEVISRLDKLSLDVAAMRSGR